MIEIIKFAKDKNIKVILVKQAYYFEPNIILELNNYSIRNLLDEYKNNTFKDKYKLNDEINFWSVMGTVLNKNIDELKNFNNVVIVDPVKDLVNSGDNFTDYLHLTPKGNQILASKIYKKIQD